MVYLYILLVILIILLIAGWFIGNYFFNISLKRDSTWFANGGHEVLNPDVAPREPTKEDKEYQQQLDIGAAFYDQDAFEDVTIQSKDGLKLYARVMKTNPENNKWILFVHGYRSNGKKDWAYSAKLASEKGYNAVIPDQRTHGKSEGKYIGMGYPEHFDMIEWITYIIQKQPQAEIILWGCSMGAATVMMTLGEQLPDNVTVAIADCGYTGAKPEFAHVLKDMMKLPIQPILGLANIVTKIRTGNSLYIVNSIKALNKNTLPVLFIHGGKDTFVPTEMVYENRQATKGPSDLLVIPDAPHFSSMIYNPELYYKTAFDFLKKYE